MPEANGNRVLTRQIHSGVIEAEIVIGCSMGKVVLIARGNSNPTDSALPFKFKRRHFPLRPASAMTINKAQGQTLRMAGLYLPTQPWSVVCGQNYGRSLECSPDGRQLQQGQARSKKRIVSKNCCSQGTAAAVVDVESHDQTS